MDDMPTNDNISGENSNMEDIIESYCGLQCNNCDAKKSHRCGGCVASNGILYQEKCEIAECAKSRGKRFCGECEQFPCEIIERISHDPEYGDNGTRIERCRAMKAEFVREARAGINPIGYCGHHCDFCFLGQWCGGCRSNYNCCSYATLFDNNSCPNVSCAMEKNLKGCYECDHLNDCEKGYYERSSEYVAKATALFIKKYGEDRYTSTLRRAIGSGEDYPKTFDASGSVANALTILEKYL